ncbi:protease pro-enzyme activation domain-containing protein [Acidianus sp. HS-5]|uniref:S53 family peptidase n=1 Tax=Acidianus sp. HS-5 TaxID=2886040 RepID=UPI001EEE4AD7|nr:protease pro-enzyme activation domain-containing protein [Acidianus sp. HS-5]
MKSISVFILVFMMFLGSIMAVEGIAYSQPSSCYIAPNIGGTPIRSLPANTPIYVNIFLPPKNMNEFLFLMQEEFHGQVHLSRQQIIKEFGNQQRINEISSYLQSNGFNVVFTTPFSLMAEAPAGKVDALFSTQLYLYKDGQEIFYKPNNNPVIPSTLHDLLIGGLTNYTTASPQYLVLGKLVNGVLKPTNSSRQVPLGLNFAFTMYTPQDFEGAYNVTGPEGKNVTVAIIDAWGDPLICEDVQQFDQEFHLPPANLTIIPVGPYFPLEGLFTGWYEETALDVEAVHSMAPYAHIDLVLSHGCAFCDILQAIIYIDSAGNAQVVDMSFGAPENEFSDSGFYAFYEGTPIVNYPLVNYYFELGTAEGITFIAASGDSGAYAGTYTTYGGVSFPSSSPFVLSVGGTSLYPQITSGYVSAMNSTAVYGYENAWSVLPQYEELGTSTVSSDGGYSTFFPSPYWQRHITSSDVRTIPDVSADANPYTGFTTIVLGTEEVIGGTSLSTQLWGGVIADIDSYLGKPLGLAAPLLYAIYENSTLYQEAFHEITQGFNGKYSVHAGYNLVTGVGSPNVGMLEEAVKGYLNAHPELEISLTTCEPGFSMPWYCYCTTFNIVADISYPNGTPVTTGSFTAYVYTLKGYLDNVTLIYNGTYWVGNFTITKGDTPNCWTVVVNGTSGGMYGVSQVDVDVGYSFNIIAPPEGIIPVNAPVSFCVCVYNPLGMPVTNTTVTMTMIYHGKVVSVSSLVYSGHNGDYKGTLTLLYPQPQGTYVIKANNTFGSAYEWEYFGLVVYGAVIPPINDGMTSASPGENITVLGYMYNPCDQGIFTAKAYAELISLNGQVVAKAPMTLAPDKTILGIYNLFGYHIANITIPDNVTPGYYKVVVTSCLSTIFGPSYGNFTTFIYISNSTLSYHVKSVSEVYEGQYVKVLANITYTNGTEVKFGEFTAGFIPAQENYRQICIEFDTGISMQYNSTLGEWEAVYQIPSILTEQCTIYKGFPEQSLSGFWDVIVEGTSASGENVISSYSYFDVLKYTYVGTQIITPTNASNVPLLIFNGTNYILQGVYSPKIKVEGIQGLIVRCSIIGSLCATGSTVTVEKSTVFSITASSSSLSLIQDTVGPTNDALNLVNSNATLISTVIEDSAYAFNITSSKVSMEGVSYINVTKLSNLPTPTIVSYYPVNITTSSATVTFNISGQDLKVIGVLINGEPITFTSTPTSTGISVSVPFNASTKPSGVYYVTIEVYDGLSYNLTTVVFNSYHEVVQSQSVSSLSSQQKSLSSQVSSQASSLSSLSSTLSSESSQLSSQAGRIGSASSSATDGEILGVVGIILAIVAIVLLLVRGGKRE